MNNISSRDDLVREIANALEIHLESGVWYLNLTTQEVGLWTDPTYLGNDMEWPRIGDEVVAIDTLESYESFQAMKEFASQQPETTALKIYHALSERRPFARFKACVEALGLRDAWHAFKDAWYLDKAEEWLRDENVDFVDGRIVATGSSFVWDDDDDDEF
ncbi:MAG: hypothetical protein IJT30_10395 [Muribaculaceae bacterium]|nr:hypothetical protein [Muribaculaceae bacterium]